VEEIVLMHRPKGCARCPAFPLQLGGLCFRCIVWFAEEQAESLTGGYPGLVGRKVAGVGCAAGGGVNLAALKCFEVDTRARSGLSFSVLCGKGARARKGLAPTIAVKAV
jgi:hypothetical protein